MRWSKFSPVLAFLFIISCHNSDKQAPIEETRFLMDTLVRVAVYDRSLPKSAVHEAIDRAFGIMGRIEAKTSSHIDSSDVVLINRKAGRESFDASPETIKIINQSGVASELTFGAFDITVGAVKSLWEFNTDQPRIPSESEIRRHLDLVDYRKIQINEENVLLPETGIRLDLGGVAKGYIIDRGVDVLKQAGIRAGIVDAGGDLRIFGDHPYREAWKIAVRHPRSTEGEFFGVIQIGEASIATSGDYERYFIREGIRYHHILNPKTGYPADECISVTITAQSAMMADAFATAVFVLGPEEGMALVERIDGVEGMIVFKKAGGLDYLISDGLRDKIQLNENIQNLNDN